MNVSSNINLIKSNTHTPEYLIPIQNQFRNFSILVLFIVIASGLITISTFIIFGVRQQVLLRQKTALLKRLEAQKVKENLFLAIKSRIGVVDSALSSSFPKSKLFENATDIASFPQLESMIEDDKRKIHVFYKTDSVENAIEMAGRAVSLYDIRRIKNVKLSDFSIGLTGYNISFEYDPVWE